MDRRKKIEQQIEEGWQHYEREFAGEPGYCKWTDLEGWCPCAQCKAADQKERQAEQLQDDVAISFTRTGSALNLTKLRIRKEL